MSSLINVPTKKGAYKRLLFFTRKIIKRHQEDNIKGEYRVFHCDEGCYALERLVLPTNTFCLCVYYAIRIHVTSTVINDQNFNFKNSSCFFNLLYYSNVK